MNASPGIATAGELTGPDVYERPVPGNPSGGWQLYQAIRLILRWLRWWVRLEVRGLDAVPGTGPILIVSNHDTWLDPLALIESLMWKGRQVRFLAKSTLWKSRILAWVLNRAGQIPVRRGEGDQAAVAAAVTALDSGEAIGIFPEGTISRGEYLRARTGVARLARACPGVPVVLAAIHGSTDLARFPRRPRVVVEYFRPDGGGLAPGEDLAAFSARLLAEIRERVPPSSNRSAREGITGPA
ncbi:MAG: 1-acyl-sn-glycerol-3-phosphate acyltransferase [Solirubrobacterales bacterium]|nr:1-acyl-sn-glycerol-3-phosphate acyltransferase [Solirubrobacterales bacterium]